MNSILNTIKKELGLELDCWHFDAILIPLVNTALSTLTQLGIGPKEGFTISDDSVTWEEFMGDDPRQEMAKTYVFLKTKMVFDPPMSSSVSDVYGKMINEFEWRLTVVHDEKTLED